MTITTQTIEQRVTQLEAKLAQLEAAMVEANAKDTSTSTNWIDQLAGSISDEELFLEALESGQQQRRECSDFCVNR